MGLYGSKLNNFKSIKVEPYKEDYNKYGYLAEKAIQQIQFKRQAIKSSQKCRYIANNKYKSLFLLTIIIFIIYLIYFEIPINGDYKENGNKITNYFSILGYISMNIFVVLLLTVLGVETYMIKDELRNLSDEEIITNKEIDEMIQQLPNALKLVRQNAFKDPNLINKIKKATDIIEIETKQSTISGNKELINNIIIQKNGSNYNNNLIDKFDYLMNKLKIEYENKINIIQKKIYLAKDDIEESTNLNKNLEKIHKYYLGLFKKVFFVLN